MMKKVFFACLTFFFAATSYSNGGSKHDACIEWSENIADDLEDPSQHWVDQDIQWNIDSYDFYLICMDAEFLIDLEPVIIEID